MAPIYVKPAPGGRVRMPERNSKPMPDDGIFVQRNSYYERLIETGDVVIAEPPTAPAKPAAQKPSAPAASEKAKASKD